MAMRNVRWARARYAALALALADCSGRPTGRDAGADAGAPVADTWAAPGFAADCATAFAGRRMAPPPEIVYPLDGSFHPKNVRTLTWAFSSAEHALFRLRVGTADGRLNRGLCFALSDATCMGARCTYAPPADVWGAVLDVASGGDVTAFLEGIKEPWSPVGRSSPVVLSVSADVVDGQLFFYSTSLPGVLRAPSIGAQAQPFITAMSATNPKDCAGCHTISLDGKRLAAIYGHADDFLGVTSAATPENFTMKPETTRSNFQDLNGDGSRLIANFNGKLILRDGASGAEIVTLDLPHRAVMPAWSHDGTRVVYVQLLDDSKMFYDVAACCGRRDGGDWLVTDAGHIAVVATTGPDTFGAPTVVVPAVAPDYNYYPVFSPDDEWIVFVTGSKPGYSPIAQDGTSNFSYGVPKDLLVSHDQRSNRLRMARADGSAPPFELTRASAPKDSTPSWPQVMPWAVDGGFMVTISSKRDYGFTVTGGKLPQLWMFHVAPDRSGDPSSAPIWLAGQDVHEGNHLGVWRR